MHTRKKDRYSYIALVFKINGASCSDELLLFKDYVGISALAAAAANGHGHIVYEILLVGFKHL
jgi:hypothetical protein